MGMPVSVSVQRARAPSSGPQLPAVTHMSALRAPSSSTPASILVARLHPRRLHASPSSLRPDAHGNGATSPSSSALERLRRQGPPAPMAATFSSNLQVGEQGGAQPGARLRPPGHRPPHERAPTRRREEEGSRRRDGAGSRGGAPRFCPWPSSSSAPWDAGEKPGEAAETEAGVHEVLDPCRRVLDSVASGRSIWSPARLRPRLEFFEYGTEAQQKQLASLLKGYVLTLSLQMYGCRVIQKALEVVEVEQQTQMALELDGTIMKCVRDQNGNHVIQKCIECIPQERIQFIISAFYGHVVDLSTHPYGCRVIQRVLEHCDDESTQSAMMEEIMQSVVPLTQDQYGNYVIQHVLQHGKPEERTSIIRQLAGQIVKMSQQKFASNVVEKCLSFGSREERQILIDEMLGTTDENEPLQAMMKDQFANYVVQKVLETCDDHNRELILSRIKVHLNALKRYTYGKHIVARVEKLIQAGERRIGVSSQSLRD